MTRPLLVGVQLPEAEYEARWSQVAEVIRTAEGIGLDSIWYGDHLLYRGDGQPTRGPWEVWSLLAATAAITSRIRFGPLVASTSFHNPAMLAKKAATIDEISGGRLVLGLGAGWNEAEYDAFGFPFDHRISRFEEAFTIIRTLLTTGRCDFAGAYYTLTDCELRPRGPRPEGIPLMVGSIGPRMLSITLPYVDAWNVWFTDFANNLEGYLPLRQVVDDACLAVGRDPNSVARTVALFVGYPGALGRLTGNLAKPDVVPVSGDPAALAETLRGFAAAGLSEVQLVLDPITVETVAALEPMLALLDA